MIGCETRSIGCMSEGSGLTHRYLVFAGQHYDYGDSWSNYVGSYPSLDEAKESAWQASHPPELVHGGMWAQVVDLEIAEEVANECTIARERNREQV